MMKPYPHVDSYRRGEIGRPSWSQTPRVLPGALNMVTAGEMEALQSALQQGRVPFDLQAKLSGLRTDHPREFYLKRHSESLIALLTARDATAFCRIRPEDCEQLLRMLAYVRKDDDAIPDTQPDGFEDDHDLMRMTCADLRPALEAFKAWHLSRRVALLWTQESASGGC